MPTGQPKNRIPHQKTEAIGMKSRSANIFRTWDIEFRDLVTKISSRNSCEREKEGKL